MKNSKRLIGQPLLQAILAALLVIGATWLAIDQRPVEYEARIGLLASPALVDPAVSRSGQDFPGVVAQSMAAIVDVAHSSSALSEASQQVEGSPSPDDLFNAVSVDVVPASGLARLTVRAKSPEIARQLAVVIARQIVAKDLISTVGVFRLLDDQADVRRVAPDPALAAGLALAAGAATAVAVIGLNALFRPSRRQRVERALALAGVTRPVAILWGGRHAYNVDEIGVLAAASARPVRVVGLTPFAGEDADKLAAALASSGIRLARDQDGQETSVVGVVAEGDDSASLGFAVAALPERAQLISVVFR